MWAAGVSLYLLATGRLPLLPPPPGGLLLPHLKRFPDACGSRALRRVPFEGSSLIQLFERIAVGSYAETPQLAAQPQLQSLLRSLLCVAQQERLGAEEARAEQPQSSRE